MHRSLLCLAALAVTASAQAPLPPPLSYDCQRAKTPIRIDGKLDDPAWKKAKWTSDFVDIEGPARPMPRFHTRAKMLWDDHYL
ncbi:MAG TPA: sugar-binding protein, partial [Acidobacteriaceae bacterium]|nr:sugar-binding protein [Acidobacteriaceae bacterium]